MRADLHLHSSASDGRYTPQELVRLAAAAGVEILALTDHDTVAGIPAAAIAAQKHSIRFIPGVELGTDIPIPEVHLLGYFIDHTHDGFRAGLEEQRQSRVERAHQMLEKLAALGLPLSWERVRSIAAGESIGRPHIALAMVEKGFVPTLRDAFAQYIGKGGPAYVERRKLTPESAVRLICLGQGLAVLAHPAEVGQLDQLLPRLVAAGLVGMEAYYNNYPPDIVNSLLAAARRYGLLPLGGSDYHGVGASDTPIGGVNIPDRVVADFLALAGQKARFCHPVG